MSRMIFPVLTGVLVACGGDGVSHQPASLWVYADAGAVQCEHSGHSIEETAAVLKRHGVAVEASECGYLTDRAVITVCGAGTLDINLHRIGAGDLESAIEADFEPVASLSSDAGVGYERRACADRPEDRQGRAQVTGRIES